mgnify:CR=1 FL=1
MTSNNFSCVVFDTETTDKINYVEDENQLPFYFGLSTLLGYLITSYIQIYYSNFFKNNTDCMIYMHPYEFDTEKLDIADNNFSNNDDFIKATNFLVQSIKIKEKICILGDYDVDGAASTSLLVRFFNFINQPHFYYIPDRETDGYGATKDLFKKLILKKPKLIIMVDCGSTSNEAINFLNENNIKSIVIDHHEISKPYPKSNIIIKLI